MILFREEKLFDVFIVQISDGERLIKDIDDQFIKTVNKVYHEKSALIEVFSGIIHNIDLIKWLKLTLRGKKEII